MPAAEKQILQSEAQRICHSNHRLSETKKPSYLLVTRPGLHPLVTRLPLYRPVAFRPPITRGVSKWGQTLIID